MPLLTTLHISLLFQVQLSDFENAAYTVFIVLLTRVVLSYCLNFVIPISKVRILVFVIIILFFLYQS